MAGFAVDSISDKNSIRDHSIFLEERELGGAYGLAIRIDRVLLDQKTPFQHLVVAEAGTLGRVLLLDGDIQMTEFDESGYHEMLAHVPLLTHPDPRRVLIVGGGDAGTLREVLKHPGVIQVDLCEIDAAVIEASQRFFPGLAASLDDPRTAIHIADGVQYVKDRPGSWDVILVDSSDPEGPAEGIFKKSFYRDLKKALLPGGVVVTQSESAFLFEGLIRDIFAFLPDFFPMIGYYHTLVPTYASGIIGFAFCSLGPDPLKADPDPSRLEGLKDLHHYSPALHQAAFVLPRRFLRLLPDAQAAGGAVILNRRLLDGGTSASE
jgi:spermidine synthase